MLYEYIADAEAYLTNGCDECWGQQSLCDECA